MRKRTAEKLLKQQLHLFISNLGFMLSCFRWPRLSRWGDLAQTGPVLRMSSYSRCVSCKFWVISHCNGGHICSFWLPSLTNGRGCRSHCRNGFGRRGKVRQWSRAEVGVKNSRAVESTEWGRGILLLQVVQTRQPVSKLEKQSRSDQCTHCEGSKYTIQCNGNFFFLGEWSIIFAGIICQQPAKFFNAGLCACSFNSF